MEKQTIREEEIKQNYKWFCESCEKRRMEPIKYNQFKKEFLKTKKENQTPEEQERLKQMSRTLKQTMRLLK